MRLTTGSSVNVPRWGCLLFVASCIRIQAMTLESSSKFVNPENGQISRRNIIVATASGALTASNLNFVGDSSAAASTFKAYQVEPDPGASLNPTLLDLSNESFLNKIATPNGGALWLGEHHNAKSDHNVQVDILREVSKRRNRLTAVGLEQVQVQFQPVLDQYNDGLISLEQMRAGVQWDTRWIWPFAVYAPVFQTARDLCMPLVALNVNSEDMTLVEKGGFEGLGRDRLKNYIRDAPGFVAFSRQKQFQTYVDYVIQPSYRLHQAMGLLQYTMGGEKLLEEMPFRNFLCGRILWDEAMASNAAEWTRQNPGGLIVGIVGADHVKFRNGIPGRFSRMAGRNHDCISVMLNPTLVDTRPPGTVVINDDAITPQNPEKITLQLRYLKDNVALDSSTRSLPESTGGVMPLADFLVIGA